MGEEHINKNFSKVVSSLIWVISLKTGDTFKARYCNIQRILHVSFKLLISKPMEMSNNEVMITSIATHTGSAFKKVCMLLFFLFFYKNKKISSLLELFGPVNDLFLEWNVGIILARFGEFEHKRKLMPSYFRILCSILPTDIAWGVTMVIIFL